jgi:hypothetical protein
MSGWSRACVCVRLCEVMNWCSELRISRAKIEERHLQALSSTGPEFGLFGLSCSGLRRAGLKIRCRVTTGRTSKTVLAKSKSSGARAGLVLSGPSYLPAGT